MIHMSLLHTRKTWLAFDPCNKGYNSEFNKHAQMTSVYLSSGNPFLGWFRAKHTWCVVYQSSWDKVAGFSLVGYHVWVIALIFRPNVCKWVIWMSSIRPYNPRDQFRNWNKRAKVTNKRSSEIWITSSGTLRDGPHAVGRKTRKKMKIYISLL